MSSARKVDLVVSSEPWRQMASGVGASWHSMLSPTVGAGGSAMGGSPPVIARHERLWQSLESHADWLGLNFIRLEMEWRQFEPERGVYTWDSPEMRILDRICAWAQRRGADVMLQCSWINAVWCCFPELADDPALRVYSAASDIEGWARGWVVLLRELIEARGYDCIKWIHLVNEPTCSWWFLPETVNDFKGTHDAQMAYLGEAYRRVGVAVREAGLAVKLMGPGETDLPLYESIAREPWFPHVDDVDFHGYCSNFDWDDPNKQLIGVGWGYRLGERMVETLAKYLREANASGKGLYLTEFGTQTYGSYPGEPGPNSFKATLKDTEQLVRCINMGLDGLSHWSFVNRGDLDGQWQYVDTWSDWPKLWLSEAKPHLWSYYVLGMATRHLPQRALLLPTTVSGSEIDGIPRVWATAVRSPLDHSTTVLIVNDSFESIDLSYQGPVCSHRVTVSEQTELGALDRYERAGDSLELPLFSLTILTDAPLAPNQPGRC